MSILYGFYKADAGEIFIRGEKTVIPDSQAAIAAGIGMVFQHFKLVENFTVLENVILGAEDGGLLRPSLAKARKELLELESEYGLKVDPDATIENIGVGMQQRVEILKALYRQAEILILDEPTGVLTPAEADQLFRILGTAAGRGKNHHPDHAQAARDHGDHRYRQRDAARAKWWGTVKTSETKPRTTGRTDGWAARFCCASTRSSGDTGCSWCWRWKTCEVVDDAGVERVKGINLTVRAGEILGIAGVGGQRPVRTASRFWAGSPRAPAAVRSG